MQEQIQALEKTIEELNSKVSYLERVVDTLLETQRKKMGQAIVDRLQRKISDYE
jgi:flagellar biosynthesis chaperone FliJ